MTTPDYEKIAELERSELGIGDEEAHDSWDAFWSEVQREELAERGGLPTETIRGVQVVIPHDVPMKFDRLLEKAQGSSSEADTKAALAMLFGADVLDRWVEAGMGGQEFQVVLMWGIANGRGKPKTFREAYEMVRQAEEGKAESSTRKKGGKGGSGGRSKRTSKPATG